MKVIIAAASLTLLICLSSGTSHQALASEPDTVDQPQAFGDDGVTAMFGELGWWKGEGTATNQGSRSPLNDTSDFDLEFAALQFLAKNFALGGAVQSNVSETENESTETSLAVTSLSLLARYFVPLNDTRTAFIWLGGRVGTARLSDETTSKFNSGITTGEADGTLIGGGAGFLISTGGEAGGFLSLRVAYDSITMDLTQFDGVNFLPVTTIDQQSVGIRTALGVYF